MGNVSSSYFEEKNEDPFWSNDASKSKIDVKSSTSHNPISAKTNFNEAAAVIKNISEANKEKLSEFKLELGRKHEKRREIIAGKRKEMGDLRAEVERLKKENESLKATRVDPSDDNLTKFREEIERLRQEKAETDFLRKQNEELKEIVEEKTALLEESQNIIEKNRELRINISELQNDLQRLNSEILNFETEREDYRIHVVALKDVISVSKHMLQIRETQLKELKEKVESIEKSLCTREAAILSEDLRKEYERQIENMRNLRLLYEERQRAERKEKEELRSQLADVKKDLEHEQMKNGELDERISQLELDNSKKYDEIKTLESNLGLSKAENREYQEELAVINQLFSEALLRYNKEIDLDKLQKHLEENHGLLKDIVVNEVSSEVSYALPKVLLELINQLHENEEQVGEENAISKCDREGTNNSTRHQMSSAEEIVENLPKVWKVLIELLSHQIVPTNNLTDEQNNDNPCYKTVVTPKGTSLVLSVSQTFIRLKDLILEKKSLEKETAHLKHLNCHLENRLQDQEKRLEVVQSELSKTWLVVGKLQKQHQLLHTQEKILRYELAQKRKLLNELKEELEYSREKWAQAREKNTSTEEQWRQLRSEFANRRNTTTEDVNNSAESGYSDDREGLSDEEPGYETDVSECAQKTGEDADLNEDIVSMSQIETITDTNEQKSEEENTPTNLDSEKQLTDLNKISDIEQIHEVNGEEKILSSNINNTEMPSTSISRLEESRRTFEERLAKREERLKRLETQAESLVTKTANTANRSVEICNKLDGLHIAYGQSQESIDTTTEDDVEQNDTESRQQAQDKDGGD
ncbi:uncharacterized protein LOC130897114 isoform X1 [Diorhabda carinulata]|uniref:uncharacterized protein LOC130897114 isoform X1 n=1 Tax=Diorhabda carinulata TaxID=1163345 RepID=UPI0025A04F5B|nr:uncharacterized protein LOC130897114 isoform X1 [Diorhabda carinulata]XP_057661707.1 uncharacterized protein LOC130897114 isoform X1 [Diorhabda carinulata]